VKLPAPPIPQRFMNFKIAETSKLIARDAASEVSRWLSRASTLYLTQPAGWVQSFASSPVTAQNRD
jgi:hypothetical protein